MNPSPVDPETLQAAARLALSCLDLTELGDACTAADVDRLCQRAQGRAASGAELPLVAAVCVWPRFAAQARRQLPASIAVAGVVNFPSGDEPIAAVREQIAQLRAAGAQEVDCVLPWKALLAGDEAHCAQVLAQVREASQGLVLKLILESGALERDDTIARACAIGLRAGVDFLKTSTGKIPQGASLAAARTMLGAIAADPRRDRLGFKPSGGLRTVADVLPYLEAVQATLGADALVPARFRIGASGLWHDIAQVLGVGQPPAAATTTY
ncbi:MAG: deoxyribose-phosphate aldolase [Comamonadaceae bacterium]|nr:deoxyribose-phosphate aldolase [Comamonadaceae bacterium]